MTRLILCVVMGMQSLPARAQVPVAPHEGPQVSVRTSVDRVLEAGTLDAPEGAQSLSRLLREGGVTRLQPESPALPLPGDVSRSFPINRRADRARRQVGGGGKTAAIVSLVSLAAGLASTYYVIKVMRDNSDDAERR